ncbi:translation initiation factor IF-2-like [Canis lupus dingo]|uniref:translation initiation factor IF-2-like n=1 Tax=Canis lupus dingo TaxID=286419 RepID=UPI000DC6B9FD|nr:translation initiation factor IF-2-like [Canis lupus dingo]
MFRAEGGREQRKGPRGLGFGRGARAASSEAAAAPGDPPTPATSAREEARGRYRARPPRDAPRPPAPSRSSGERPRTGVRVPERRRAHTRDNLERRSPRSAHARESPETSAPGQSFRHAGRGHRGSTNPRPAAGDRRPGACVLGTWRLRRGTGGRQARAAARCGAAPGVAGDVAPGPPELKAAAPRSVFQLRSVLN